MRTFIIPILVLVYSASGFADYYATSNYYCRDLVRQQMVDINQLEGIWYLIEKIVHTEERHLKVNLTTCPVIHISEDRISATTYNPLYKNYGTTYGAGYPHASQNVQNNRNPLDPASTFSSEQDYMKQIDEYNRRTTYDADRRRGMTYLQRHFAMKYLKLYMSDGSSTLEQHLRYNNSNPGFWIISGPEQGHQDNVKHFAGTVQVMKAVGNHLVLITCNPSKDTKELYTMILSRENMLDSLTIHAIHSMLINQGLRTNFIERSCNGVPTIGLSLGLILLSLLRYLIV